LAFGKWGGRPLESHQEFVDDIGNSRVQYVDDESASPDSHATHVAGTMIAEGEKDKTHGMAPEAKLYAWEVQKDTEEMSKASDGTAQLSNHSYGPFRGWENLKNGPRGKGWYWWGAVNVSTDEDFKFGFYTERAKDWDEVVHNNEYYLPVTSAGNDRGDGPSSQPELHYYKLTPEGDWQEPTTVRRPLDCSQGTTGYDCLAGPAVAKNPIVVGALKDDSTTPADFSAFGPTDDGRIKPDLMANGVSVYSSVTGSNSSYGTKTGTSMAAPAVTGSIALMKELLGSAKYQASTLKAILLHTADNFIGPKSGPDYKTGWGRMNTERAANVIKTEVNAPDTVHVVDQVTLDNGTTREFEVTTTESLESLRATIAWTDPPGVSPLTNRVDPSDKMLVNDLDLRVIRKSNGREHRPYKLDPSNPGSQTVLRGDNKRDNVEQVFIPNPASEATYTVRVSHDGPLNGFSQDFGLVVTGNSSLTLTGSGSDPLSVTLYGPDKLNTGENGTWTASVTGGSGSTSYDWEYQSPDSNTWKSASCSGPDCTRSFSNNDDQAKTGRIRVKVTKGNQTARAAQTVEVVRPDLYVDISGSFNLDSWEEGYWSAYTSGGIGSISYSWEVNQTWSSTWSAVSCSGTSCSHSFINTCDWSRTAQIRVIATSQTQADTSSQAVQVSGSGGTLTAGDVEPNAPPCGYSYSSTSAKAVAGGHLPVQSLEATARAGRTVRLSWRAAGSAPQAPVTVQHRTDSTAAWTDLDVVQPADSVGTGAETGPAYQFRADRLDPGPHQFRIATAAPGPAKQSMRATQAVTATVEMNDAYRLSTYPNPVRKQATVELAVKEQQEVTVQVYDVLGRQVTTLHTGRLPAQETKRLPVDASELDLSSGTYFVRVQGEDFVATERLTVVQ